MENPKKHRRGQRYESLDDSSTVKRSRLVEGFATIKGAIAELRAVSSFYLLKRDVRVSWRKGVDNSGHED